MDFLQIRLVFVATFSGAVRSSAENAPRQVNGILGGSVSLPLNISSTNIVIETEWMFQAKDSQMLLIAEFKAGGLLRPDPSDRFGNRLEMANKTTLRILDLRREDRGLYKARAKLTTSEIEDHMFNLTVYGQVPDVNILPRLTLRTPEGCSVTLQCLASGEDRLNISWKGGALENCLDCYKLSENGTDLHLFWRPSVSNSDMTCVISNPVDQKTLSFNLLSICPSEGARRPWHWGAMLAVILLLLLGAGLGIWVWKNKKRKYSE